MGVTPVEPWRPMTDLLAGPDVDRRNVLLGRIETVRIALAGPRPIEAVELKVAASVAHLGLVARVVAPAFALTVIGGLAVRADLSQLWWQDRLGGAYPLSLPDAAPDGGSVPDLIRGPVQAITAAIRSSVPVSGLVLQGNVASAINGAANLIGRQRPELARASYALADALLNDDILNPARSAAGPAFRRSSCCLIYRASPGQPAQTCGDCILTPSSLG
jgi:hypothetical protein